jgi:hypothetical protein
MDVKNISKIIKRERKRAYCTRRWEKKRSIKRMSHKMDFKRVDKILKI